MLYFFIFARTKQNRTHNPVCRQNMLSAVTERLSVRPSPVSTSTFDDDVLKSARVDGSLLATLRLLMEWDSSTTAPPVLPAPHVVPTTAALWAHYLREAADALCWLQSAIGRDGERELRESRESREDRLAVLLGHAATAAQFVRRLVWEEMVPLRDVIVLGTVDNVLRVVEDVVLVLPRGRPEAGRFLREALDMARMVCCTARKVQRKQFASPADEVLLADFERILGKYGALISHHSLHFVAFTNRAPDLQTVLAKSVGAFLGVVANLPVVGAVRLCRDSAFVWRHLPAPSPVFLLPVLKNIMATLRHQRQPCPSQIFALTALLAGLQPALKSAAVLTDVCVAAADAYGHDVFGSETAAVLLVVEYVTWYLAVVLAEASRQKFDRFSDGAGAGADGGAADRTLPQNLAVVSIGMTELACSVAKHVGLEAVTKDVRFGDLEKLVVEVRNTRFKPMMPSVKQLLDVLNAWPVRMRVADAANR